MLRAESKKNLTQVHHQGDAEKNYLWRQQKVLRKHT